MPRKPKQTELGDLFLYNNGHGRALMVVGFDSTTGDVVFQPLTKDEPPRIDVKQEPRRVPLDLVVRRRMLYYRQGNVRKFANGAALLLAGCEAASGKPLLG